MTSRRGFSDAHLTTDVGALGYCGVVDRATAPADHRSAPVPPSAASEAVVQRELLAVRKLPRGLSPHSMTGCPTIVALLGDGDPLMAFTRLETRILARLELDDDVTPLNAVAYSLGLASHGKTHLERLNDFGDAYGYEVRQARRHSDLGVQQLATLICSNWIVDTVPVINVVLTGHPDGSAEVAVATERPRFVDMCPLRIQWYRADGRPGEKLHDVKPPPHFEPAAQPTHGNDSDALLPDDLCVHQRLVESLMLSPPGDEGVHGLRIAWPGEVWPCFQLQVIGPPSPDTIISSQTIGNAVVLQYQNITDPKYCFP